MLTKQYVVLVPALLLGLSFSTQLMAAPLDGEVNLLWWANDLEVDAIGGEVDAGAIGGDAEIWADKWGVGAALFRSDLSGSNTDGDIDYLNIDVKRRFVSATENNFLALGLGWENVDFGDGTDTNGLRVVFEGRVGLTPLLYLYGQTAWLPALEDTPGRSDADAFEIEAGLSVVPFPYLTLRAGYRQFSLDFASVTGANESSKSSGLVFGAGVHW